MIGTITAVDILRCPLSLKEILSKQQKTTPDKMDERYGRDRRDLMKKRGRLDTERNPNELAYRLATLAHVALQIMFGPLGMDLITTITYQYNMIKIKTSIGMLVTTAPVPRGQISIADVPEIPDEKEELVPLQNLEDHAAVKTSLRRKLVTTAPVPRGKIPTADVSEDRPEDEDGLAPLECLEDGAMSSVPADTSSGLQGLADVEKLVVTKKVAMKQLLSLQTQRSRYVIKAAGSALVYHVLEENTSRILNWWFGFLCYGLRPCQLKIQNKAGEEIIRIVRPFAFTTKVTPCQLQRMEVYSPPGKLIGTIEQQWTPMKPWYSIINPEGEELFSVQGPANTLSIYRDLQFDILRPSGDKVGSTWKRWRGLAHALFRSPTMDKFGLAFQKNLTVEEKALLLASTLLVDYMYYDS